MTCVATDAVALTKLHDSCSQNFGVCRWRDGTYWMLLDVGGGIGVIISELAGIPIASAAIVEASPAYLEVARREVGLKYGSRPIRFVGGDFALIAGTLPDADVVTLDRVVCCYPDVEVLLVAAAARTRQVLAFTYPRDRWYVRTNAPSATPPQRAATFFCVRS